MSSMLFALAALAADPTVQERAVSDPYAALNLVLLDETELPADALRGRAVVFVNVASRCGFTPQYDGLQQLYAANAAEGLVVVGVPSNQFGAQEPGAPEEIAQFCKLNYGVAFPLLEKQDVNGANRSALYTWLVGSEVGGDKDVAWNFEKFVVDRQGQVVARFGSRTTPDSAELYQAIRGALK